MTRLLLSIAQRQKLQNLKHTPLTTLDDSSMRHLSLTPSCTSLYLASDASLLPNVLRNDGCKPCIWLMSASGDAYLGESSRGEKPLLRRASSTAEPIQAHALASSETKPDRNFMNTRVFTHQLAVSFSRRRASQLELEVEVISGSPTPPTLHGPRLDQLTR